MSDYEIFEAVRRAADVGISPRYALKRPGEANRVCLARSRSTSGLGWSPTGSLQDGVNDSVAYFRDRHLDGKALRQ